MPLGLTKQEVAALTDEQQQTLAKIVIDDWRLRRKLMESAKSYSGYRWLPAGIAIAFLLLWQLKPGWAGFLPSVTLALAFVIQFHANGINRRIDAVLKLMELEKSVKGIEPPTDPDGEE